MRVPMVRGARYETGVAHRGTGTARWCHIAKRAVNAILVLSAPFACGYRAQGRCRVRIRGSAAPPAVPNDPGAPV